MIKKNYNKKKRENNTDNDNEEHPQREDKNSLKMIPGTILNFNLEKSIKRPRLKKFLEGIVRIAFLDFQDNQKTGFIRVYSPADANALVKHFNNKTADQEITITLDIIKGDEENAYWKKVEAKTKAAKLRKQEKQENKMDIQQSQILGKSDGKLDEEGKLEGEQERNEPGKKKQEKRKKKTKGGIPCRKGKR